MFPPSASHFSQITAGTQGPRHLDSASMLLAPMPKDRANQHNLRKRMTLIHGLFGAAKAVASHRTPRLYLVVRDEEPSLAVPIFRAVDHLRPSRSCTFRNLLKAVR